ncbi:hypothetical protein Bccel_2488 [Pseudobacteroides cellulosolvens ATCC 35603 = DSM 2933]|uniref:Uncharacterized protein n=1 Tax=Pseudobacteroides cellulosolvens ATCC 35603 = DSM 2933 TaxID=398512 RepID=A0A0L6JNB8_9FIRM|nr:hypothetical protein Bccel_2488 [Pseudobacteroides cellulosolvens ATCC 35603 = DSM 2933]
MNSILINTKYGSNARPAWTINKTIIQNAFNEVMTDENLISVL